MEHRRKYYVYELVDPRNDLPFYVGKGHGARMYAHLYEAKRSQNMWSNKIKCERINSILRSGHKIIYNKVKSGLTEQEAYTIETSLMEEYGFIIEGGILTNIRRQHRHHGTLPERKHVTKTVVQYNLQGVKLCTFPSSIAAADSLNKNKTSILNCCHRRWQTAYGFVWRFDGDSFEPPDLEQSYYKERQKPILQLSDDGEVIAEWESATAASDSLNVDRSNIITVCKGGKQKTAGGYRWCYANHAS